MQNTPRYSLASVDNALRLVRLLQSGEVLQVSSVARNLEIGRSTAHRLLSMLVHHGFAAQGPNREYMRGPALSDPSAVLPEGMTVADLRFKALPSLRKVTDAVNETSNVQLLLGEFARVIASVECENALRVSNREGQNLPARRSSGGRALLDLDLQYVSGIPLAVNDQGIEEGITALGIPVPSSALPKRLAVSIAMPSSRFNIAHLPNLVQHLNIAAQEIRVALDGR